MENTINNTASNNAASTNQTSPAHAPVREAGVASFVQSVISLLTKPTTMAKKALSYFSKPKEALIIVGISSAFCMLTSIITTIIDALVLNSKYSSFGRSAFSGIDWLEVIFSPFFTSLIAIAVITTAFFAVGRMFGEKQTSFLKIWALTAIASLPIIAASFLSSVLGNFVDYISMFIYGIGMLYTVSVFLYGWQSECDSLEGDKKFLANFVAVSLLYVICAVIVIIQFKSAFGSSAFDIFDMLDY